MIRRVVYRYLLDISDITKLLARYAFETGQPQQPAIFTTAVIPEDCGYPSIIIDQVAGPLFGCRDRKGALLFVDIRVYEDRTRSSLRLDKLGLLIWERMNRADLRSLLEAEGYELWGCEADPPQTLDDPDGFPGKLIAARIRVAKVTT